MCAHLYICVRAYLLLINAPGMAFFGEHALNRYAQVHGFECGMGQKHHKCKIQIIVGKHKNQSLV